MNVTMEELAMLIGSQQVEIFLLKKQLQAALKTLEELKKATTGASDDMNP